MNVIILEPRKWSLLLRLTVLTLLCIFTPFAVVGLHNEDKNIEIIFYMVILITLLPELFNKLFFKPTSAVLQQNQIVIKYYHGSLKYVPLNEINGYSTTKEWTRYGTKAGVLFYLKNGKHINFTEINIKALLPLTNYINLSGLPYYGTEELKPWFFSKYQYDEMRL